MAGLCTQGVITLLVEFLILKVVYRVLQNPFNTVLDL